MAESSDIKRARDGSISIPLAVEEGDKTVSLIGRESGLFIITKKRILRIANPNKLDPDLKHVDAPWEQSVFLPHGASDRIVARTILQTKELADIFLASDSDTHTALMDVAWEILNSLVSLEVILGRLSRQIEDLKEDISSNIEEYTQGQSPNPLPYVEYYDVEFRAFVNEVRRSLSSISCLFEILAGRDFGSGKFHRALKWARETRGTDSLLAQILENDQRWIRVWIDVRNALEHPKKDKYVETLNFGLEADRTIRLPTWRFVHPDYDMEKPQNLLDIFSTCIDNLLKFFEDLLVALLDGHLPETFKIEIEYVPEDARDPDYPARMRFHPFIASEVDDSKADEPT